MDAANARENRRFWDAIGPGFDATRDRPWPPVVEFLDRLPLGERVLDLACGNGRHLRVAAALGLDAVGVDISASLLRPARAVGAPLVRGLLERPPFVDGSFAAAMCIAAMHHVRGRSVRVDTWRRLRSLLAPSGQLLASAWSTDAPAAASVRTSLPRSGAVELGDAMVPWGAGSDAPRRFVHFFARDELAGELREAGWRVERTWDVALTGSAADNRFVLASQV